MRKFLNLPVGLRWYIAGVTVVGLALAAWKAPGPPQPHEGTQLAFLLVWMVVCSYFRIHLPIRGGRMTLGTAAVSLAQMLLGTREAMLVIAVGAVVTCYAQRPVAPDTGKRRAVPLYQIAFNIGNVLVSAGVAGLAYELVAGWAGGKQHSAGVLAPSIMAWVPVYFVLNTAAVAAAIALRTRQSFAHLWRENFFWAAIGAVLSALLALGVALTYERQLWWSILSLPSLYFVYHSYGVHVSRLNAARQYEQLIERARDGVVILRQDEVVYANEAFARMLRLPREELRGSDYRRFLPEGESPPRTPEDGADGEILEQTLLRADDSTAQVEISASSVYYHGHECVQSIVRDVSERHALQRQAAQGEKLRALGQMAFGVAHDFNNALMAVLGNITLARMALRSECGSEHGQTDERLQLAERAATDASDTVRRLQAFGRPGGGPLEAVDLQEIAREVLLMTRPVWRDASRAEGREIVAEVAGEQGVHVRVNPAELREGLTNLVYNAVHAMPAGGRLTFKTSRHAGMAILSVTDSGTGIPPEVLPRLFEPFYTTKGAAGSGLGLFVTYGLVSQHGGSIEVESTLGQGTTFHLRFPEAAPAAAPAVDAPVLPRVGTRVLVVDDEAEIRDVLGTMLRGAGLAVQEAVDATAALAALEREPFDLLITDLSMPEMSGLELAREARSRYPRLPILLLTGWAEGAETARANQPCVDEVLTKPVSLPALLQRIVALEGAAGGGRRPKAALPAPGR
jgi:PAS domain S-box-containing protein